MHFRAAIQLNQVYLKHFTNEDGAQMHNPWTYRDCTPPPIFEIFHNFKTKVLYGMKLYFLGKK